MREKGNDLIELAPSGWSDSGFFFFFWLLCQILQASLKIT